MVKNNTLIIVESNGKCKKIEKYTGHKCIASFGHVYALNYLRFDMQIIIDEISRTNESRIFYGINLGTYGTFKR